MTIPDNTSATLQKEAWDALMDKGVQNSISGLSQMVDQDVSSASLRSEQIDVNEAAALMGPPETLAVGVYLGVTGSAEGHMILVYQPETALRLVDMLLGQPDGETQSLEEMETSALGEIGNVMGSFFLNAMSDSTGLQLVPTPPVVIVDMVGAILDVVFADIMQESDDVTVVATTFKTQDERVSGTFLVMPSSGLTNVLLPGLGASW